jgi:uncharacterized membrane protein YhaH (DUF805 family)
MFQTIINVMRLSGRASRSGYWVSVCAAWIVGMAATPLMFFAEAFWGSEHRTPGSSDWIVLGIFVAIVACCIWVWIAASVRRLHDRDKGGWWFIPFVILPVGVNELINFQTHVQPDVNLYQQILTYVTTALGIWGFIDIGCLRGTQGENRYGPVPPVVNVFGEAEPSEHSAPPR